MRQPKIAPITLPDGRSYRGVDFLREFVWGHPAWSEEANIATFDRLVDAFKDESPTVADDDYAKLLGVMRALQFPAHVSLELAHMRNQFVLASRVNEKAKK